MLVAWLAQTGKCWQHQGRFHRRRRRPGGHWGWWSSGIKKTLVEGIAEGMSEAWSFTAMQGVALLNLVEDRRVFVHQGGVEEEPLGQSGLGASNCLPVGGAEVSAECKSHLEEQVVGKNVGESSWSGWCLI